MQEDRRSREKKEPGSLTGNLRRKPFVGKEDEKSSSLEPFLTLLPGWSARRDQPLRKLSGIGEMRHYLHSTKVSTKGRERRHFLEKNEASIHTDQRFHYKICLQREEGRNELQRWNLRPTGGERGAGRREPTFLASKL